MSAPLTKDQRDALPDIAFAVPGKRKLPLPDERHTRLAWSQLSRTQGLTPEERSAARKHILRRAKELGIDTADWERISAMRIDAMSVGIEMPEVEDHPNRMPFSGVLTKIDEPSNNPPHGSNGKCVLLSRGAVEEALPSLIGMGVDYTPGFDGHDAQRKIGVITGATIDGSDLCIEGFIYAADFPEEAAEIKANKNALGFSFEAQQILVESLEPDPLVIIGCVFTGAAILLKDKAAYTTTSLAASAAGDLNMTKEELEAILAAAIKPVTDKIATLEAAQTEMSGKIEAGKELHAKVAPHAEKLRGCAEAMTAAGIGVHTTRGHVAILNRMADAMEAEAMAGSLPHIWRDHDWPMYAAAEGKTEKDPVEDPKVKALEDKIADLTTKLEGNIAAGRAESKEPERKTLPPQITSLLAKAGIAAPEEGKNLVLAEVDRVLASSALPIGERIRLKTELARAGRID